MQLLWEAWAAAVPPDILLNLYSDVHARLRALHASVRALLECSRNLAEVRKLRLCGEHSQGILQFTREDVADLEENALSACESANSSYVAASAAAVRANAVFSGANATASVTAAALIAAYATVVVDINQLTALSAGGTLFADGLDQVTNFCTTQLLVGDGCLPIMKNISAICVAAAAAPIPVKVSNPTAFDFSLSWWVLVGAGCVLVGGGCCLLGYYYGPTIVAAVGSACSGGLPPVDLLL